MYVIQNIDTGQFVTFGEHSYTKLLQNARYWDDKQEALRQRCPGNELVRSVREVMNLRGERV